jgi:hypothetical protein
MFTEYRIENVRKKQQLQRPRERWEDIIKKDVRVKTVTTQN